MALSFESLDSADFEFLAKDIAERESGIKLTCYTAGRDGGIDADDFYQDDAGNPSVILQAKHMEKTNNKTALKNQLKAFFEKIASYGYNNPRIMVFTSMPLTRKNQIEIKQDGSDKGFSSVDVFDKTKICELLEESKNYDILRKNFKLWIAHTEVLNQFLNQDQFIDCEQFLIDAENQSSLFVQTSLYDHALTCLEEERLILIVGDPGTGKTTMTKMLALASAADGYIVRYSSDNDAQKIKRVVSADANLKEVIILDDFLGQRVLDITGNGLKNVTSLVSYIQRNKNKRLILNSRFTILNEAKHNNDDFLRMIGKIRKSIQVVNSNKLSDLDKARILCSNLKYWNVPTEYISGLTRSANSGIFDGNNINRRQKGSRGTPRYLKVVQHDNYNPRIIEYICRKEVYECAVSDSYFDLIRKHLNDPAEVWANEFDRRLPLEDRYVMFTLFSLTDKEIGHGSLRIAFQKVIYCSESMDSSRNLLGSAIGRLTGTILRKRIVGQEIWYSVVNPSVNDYVASFLREADAQAARIVENAAYSDQILRIAKLNSSLLVSRSVTAAILSGEFSSLPSLNSPKGAHLMCIVNHYDMVDDALSAQIIDAIKGLDRSLLRGDEQEQIKQFVDRIRGNGSFSQMPGLKKLFSVGPDFEKLLNLALPSSELVRSFYELALCYADTDAERNDLLPFERAVVRRELESSALERQEEIIEEALPYKGEEIDGLDDCSVLEEMCLDLMKEEYSRWREDIQVLLGREGGYHLTEDEIREIYYDSTYVSTQAIGDYQVSGGGYSTSGQSLDSGAGDEWGAGLITRLFEEYLEC